jgi:hypothetical protein
MVRNGRSSVGEKFQRSVRSILIFDDRPERVRLLCRKRPSQGLDLIAARRAPNIWIASDVGTFARHVLAAHRALSTHSKERPQNLANTQ